MPSVHRLLDVPQVRSQAKSLAELGLHAGIDLTNTASLFGSHWDRDARELGRRLRSELLKTVVRGPGSDLPLGALDPYVVDQVRACHDRAITAAMHYGAKRYLVGLGTSRGMPRSERLSRLDATSVMLRHFAQACTTRGLALAVEPHAESDPDALDLLLDVLAEVDAGLVLSPSAVLCAGHDLDQVLHSVDGHLVGLDLTDRMANDLEPRPLGQGVLADVDFLPELVVRDDIEFCVLDLPAPMTQDAVVGLNALARAAQPEHVGV